MLLTNVMRRTRKAACRMRRRSSSRSGSRKLASDHSRNYLSANNALRASFNLNHQSLKRYDTDRVAFKINILTTRITYQFTKATFARAILDYNTLNSRLRSQALFGWTPSPGTAFYAGYNDD